MFSSCFTSISAGRCINLTDVAITKWCIYIYYPVPIYRFRQEDILLYNYDYYSCIQLVMKSNQKFVVLQIILFYLRVSFAGHCCITHVQFTAFYSKMPDSCSTISLKILQHGTETDINVDILFVPCYFQYCSLWLFAYSIHEGLSMAKQTIHWHSPLLW